MVDKPKKWIHFIGVCGVTMGPLSNMFKKRGWYVTGSDKGIFPPMSDYLKEKGITLKLGFKREHIDPETYNIEKSMPDEVVVGNFISTKNKEYLYAKDKGINVKSFPEILSEYLIKDNSIVVAGTHGKTTCTALLSHIFEKAGKKPSYMIGGIPLDLEDPIANCKGKWSIVEGDEYTSSRIDPISKFFHYKTEFLLLTACSWEHTDVFKTSDIYVENFQNYVRSLPEDGLIIANQNGKNVSDVVKEARCKLVTYELNRMDSNIAKANWFNLVHQENKKKNEIVMYNRDTKEEFSLYTNLIGDHNKENVIGCVALAREMGIQRDHIIKAVETFRGIKRRLEIRLEEENLIIIDDHACSPPKVRGSLDALRANYGDWNITIIFEANVGNRTREALPLFRGVFESADEVVIPRLRKVKTKRGQERVNGKKLADFLKADGVNVSYIDDDEKLVSYISKKDVGKHLVCFMGAYGWRHMIEDLISRKS